MKRLIAGLFALALAAAGCGGNSQAERTKTTYPLTVITGPLACGSAYGCAAGGGPAS